KRGHFLYAGSVSGLLEYAKGIVWDFVTADSVHARELENKHLISAKQYTENGIQMRILSKEKPDVDCKPDKATLEDAYIYLTNQ
ncbi:MAG: ABC transporter ATP-binding protein, partial [Acetatifactor sp.]|nr:ABC transporter ATP-binding protein [Acetatifactor sp.]